jgi:hypothetical protein
MTISVLKVNATAFNSVRVDSKARRQAGERSSPDLGDPRDRDIAHPPRGSRAADPVGLGRRQAMTSALGWQHGDWLTLIAATGLVIACRDPGGSPRSVNSAQITMIRRQPLTWLAASLDLSRRLARSRRSGVTLETTRSSAGLRPRPLQTSGPEHKYQQGGCHARDHSQ